MRWFKPLPLLAYALISVAFIASLFFWIQVQSQPVNPTITDTQLFIVKTGAVTDDIASSLRDAGLIRSPLAFKLTVARLGISRQLEAGGFRLSPSMSTSDIAQTLTHGTEDVWVTLIEGWRREEIAAELAHVFTANNTPFDTDTFLNLTTGKEGYLYPDKYLIPLSADETRVVQLLTDTFNQKVVEGLADQIQASDMSLDQIVTLASLVEREAKTAGSRRMVAGILLNRLNTPGWLLQVDATLQYALGYNARTQSWWTPPTAADKTISSPYNTYIVGGLPPTPICSPSLSSIKAALNPQENQYFYYLTDNGGNMHYSVTLEEHNRNVRLYLQ